MTTDRPDSVGAEEPREAYAPPSAQTLGHGRFSAEPAVPKSRRAAQVAFVFVCTMAVLGGGTWLAKRYLRASAEQREEAKREKDRLAKVEASRKGKVFVFDAKDSKGLDAPGVEPPASTNLPRGYASSVETSEAIPRRGEAAGSDAARRAPASTPNPQAQSRPSAAVHGTMMVDGPQPVERTANPDPIASPSSTQGRAQPGGSPMNAEQGGVGGPGASPGASPPGLFGAAPQQANPAGASATALPPRGLGKRTVQDFARLQAARSPVTGTAQVSAASVGDRSMLLARGAFIPCILETQLLSSVPGESNCLVPEDVFSDDGTTLLIERGSKVSGSYGSTMRAGDSRVAVVWSRIKTTTGVVIDVESPAADGVGTMGVDGHVDNHWPERIGAAFLLSLVEDAVSIEVAKQGGASTQSGATASTTKTMSAKVLDSTINIPTTVLKQRGARLAIYVKRDLWFDSVYSLVKR